MSCDICCAFSRLRPGTVPACGRRGAGAGAARQRRSRHNGACVTRDNPRPRCFRCRSRLSQAATRGSSSLSYLDFFCLRVTLFNVQLVKFLAFILFSELGEFYLILNHRHTALVRMHSTSSTPPPHLVYSLVQSKFYDRKFRRTL